MQTIIGVRFQKAGKVYYFSPGRLDIKKGDKVIVETARGVECGETVIGPREVADSEVPPPLKVVHRIATPEDVQKVEDNKVRAKEAFAVGEKKIAEHKLPMKLVNVEYTFDMNKIVFYFTADGRIDFRELVKDLASVFRTRIELRQIGVRDEAKLMGGIGCCGRPLCCASFLGEFAPVSIRMAKEQNLSLNPTKISGICGRLMCCLKYENDGYCNGTCCGQKKTVTKAPEQGSIVATIGGDGKVISVNTQRHTATILLNNGRTVVSAWDDIVERDPEDIAAEHAAGAEEEVLEQAAGEAEDVEASMRERRPRRERGNRPRGERRPQRDMREAREGQQEGEHKSHSRPRRTHDKGERREWRENREGRETEKMQGEKPRRSRRPRGGKNRDRHPKDGQPRENHENHNGEKTE